MGKTFNSIIKAGSVTIGFPPISQLYLSNFYILLNGFLYGNYCIAYKDISRVIMVKKIFDFIQIEIEHIIPGYPKFYLLLQKDNGLILYRLLQDKISGSKAIPILSSDMQIITMYQKHGSNPIRKHFQIVIPIIWLGLILFDFLFVRTEQYTSEPFGFLTTFAFLFLFFLGFMLLFNAKTRKIILKPGREKKDIDRSVYFLLVFLSMTITGLFFFMHSLS